MSRRSLNLAAALLAAGLAGSVALPAYAEKGGCAQPVSSGVDPVATDCLYILRAAVGSATCAKPCICQPRGIAPTKAGDALICLQFSVGQNVDIDCACGSPDVESSEFTFDPEALNDISEDAQQRYVKTRYMGAFSQDADPADGDWTQDWTVSVHGNHKVWHTASGGTLNGAVPSATGSCPPGTTDIGDKTVPAAAGGGSMDLCELAGAYTAGETVVLTNDNIYRVNQASLSGTFFGNGDQAKMVAPSFGAPGGYSHPVTTHLVVEPGTLILAGTAEGLIITRGSDVHINGTKVDPVVMDSEVAYDAWVGGNDNGGARGQWSGFVLSGFASVNRCNDAVSCDGVIEGYTQVVRYGGNPNTGGGGIADDDWDCGDVSYLVIDNPGFDLGGGNDTQGLTVYGCGANTHLSYIQDNNSGDDGMEFFGGSAVGDHFVSTNNQDDNFDTDLGFTGGVQFGLIIQSQSLDGDKGFEADNGPNTDTVYQTATPNSHPHYANITVLNSPNTAANGGGISFRTWTQMDLWNVIETHGDAYGMRSENQSATTRGVTGTDDLFINNVWFYDPDASVPADDATLGILRGTDAADKTALQATLDAGSNNIVSRTLDPGVNASTGYPDQTP